MFASKDIFLTPPSGGYSIARSVRMRSSASAYFNRTLTTATNNKIWTWSSWVKRGTLSTSGGQALFEAYAGGATLLASLAFSSNGAYDKFELQGGIAGVSEEFYQQSLAVYRDPSAWYHLVCAYDSTQATASNRVKLYVNGVQLSTAAYASYSQYPSQNYVMGINSAIAHRIGPASGSGTGYFDGYLADTYFIDGQQLTPSSFGTTNAITGVWQPAKYTGTYGTNGFYLNFSDNSNNTATTIGKDYSGNANNWTPNNISVTAGTTYDSMVDSPTVGATSSNYCVLNPLDKGAGVVGAGNLSWQYTTASQAGVRSSMDMLGGNWYFEGTYTQGGSAGSSAIGIALPTWSLATYAGDTGSWSYHANGNKYVNGTGSAYGATYTTGDVIGITFNSSTGTLTGYKNGTSQGTIVSGLSVTSYFAAVSSYDSSAWAMNFGQRPFSYTPPTGFVALNTYNLPTGTITTSGSFTGNVSTDGPFVYLNGVPTAMTINGNAVTFGTNADKLANGFKVRSSSSSYNASGSNTYSITTTGAKFKNANAQTNP